MPSSAVSSINVIRPVGDDPLRLEIRETHARAVGGNHAEPETVGARIEAPGRAVGTRPLRGRTAQARRSVAVLGEAQQASVAQPDGLVLVSLVDFLPARERPGLFRHRSCGASAGSCFDGNCGNCFPSDVSSTGVSSVRQPGGDLASFDEDVPRRVQVPVAAGLHQGHRGDLAGLSARSGVVLARVTTRRCTSVSVILSTGRPGVGAGAEGVVVDHTGTAEGPGQHLRLSGRGVGPVAVTAGGHAPTVQLACDSRRGRSPTVQLSKLVNSLKVSPRADCASSTARTSSSSDRAEGNGYPGSERPGLRRQIGVTVMGLPLAQSLTDLSPGAEPELREHS